MCDEPTTAMKGRLCTGPASPAHARQAVEISSKSLGRACPPCAASTRASALRRTRRAGHKDLDQAVGLRAARWLPSPSAVDSQRAAPPAQLRQGHRASIRSRPADARRKLLVARGLTKRCTCRAVIHPTVLCRLASFVSMFSLSWRPQVNWGVSARPRCTLWLRVKGLSAIEAASCRTQGSFAGPILPWTGRRGRPHAPRSRDHD